MNMNIEYYMDDYTLLIPIDAHLVLYCSSRLAVAQWRHSVNTCEACSQSAIAKALGGMGNQPNAIDTYYSRGK